MDVARQMIGRDQPEGRLTDLRIINTVLLPVLVAGIGCVFWRFRFGSSGATAGLWALACLLGGGLVGFLFGVPRLGARLSGAASADPTEARKLSAKPDFWQSNSNLVDISDWLTKIIVGLGLINLEKIPARLWSAAGRISSGIDAGSASGHQAAVLALLVSFSVMGFMAGYLYTRIYLQGAMVRADRNDFLEQQLEEEMSEARTQVPESPADGGQPVKPALPTSNEIEQAERVQRLAGAGDQDTVVSKMQELARDYERVRSSMSPGRSRTQEMTRVVVQMRRLALAATPAIRQFAGSGSPGERLAAIAMLQTKFDPAFIGWLGQCLVKEVPFVGYQAAVAVYQAAKIAGEPQRTEIRRALEAARAELDRLKYADANRDELIALALAELDRGSGSGPNRSD